MSKRSQNNNDNTLYYKIIKYYEYKNTKNKNNNN